MRKCIKKLTMALFVLFALVSNDVQAQCYSEQTKLFACEGSEPGIRGWVCDKRVEYIFRTWLCSTPQDGEITTPIGGCVKSTNPLDMCLAKPVAFGFWANQGTTINFSVEVKSNSDGFGKVIYFPQGVDTVTLSNEWKRLNGRYTITNPITPGSWSQTRIEIEDFDYLDENSGFEISWRNFRIHCGDCQELPLFSNLPQDVTVDCSHIPSPAPVVATQCGDTLNVSFNKEHIGSGCEYLIRRWWTTISCEGVQLETEQFITVKDDSNPTLVGVPTDETVDCNAVPAPADVTATDNCDTSVQVTMVEQTTLGDCDGDYTITRIWTATDVCGNTASGQQVITVIDTTAPVLVVIPADMTLYCSDSIPEGYELPATALDNCDDNFHLTYHDEEGGNDCSRTIYRTWTTTDLCGNKDSAIQIITIIDDISPVFGEIPDDMTLECGSNMDTVSLVSATDNCDDDVEITISSQTTPGGCGSSKTIVRTWTATDDCENTTTATQRIVIVDTEAPVADSLPQDITISCDERLPSNQLSFSDICDNSVTVRYEELIEDTDCGEIRKRYWYVVDDCGNSIGINQTITVIDAKSPVIDSSPADVTISCDESIPLIPTLTATDNCDADVEVLFSERVIQSPTCRINFQLLRTWIAVDDCGNKNSVSQTITVEDSTIPVFSHVPSDTTYCGEDEIDESHPVVTDNCDNDVVTDYQEEKVQTTCGYTLTRTWTATDECGNSTSASQVIIVSTDDEAPTMKCTDKINLSLPVDSTRLCVSDIDAGSIDNCGIARMEVSRDGITWDSCVYFFCTDVNKDILVYLRATDTKENMSRCTSVVFVEDKISPICDTLTAFVGQCIEYEGVNLGEKTDIFVPLTGELLEVYNYHFGNPDTLCSDNLSCTSVQIEQEYKLSPWPCGEYMIVRRYRSVQGNMVSAWQEQRISIVYTQDWKLVLPPDWEGACGEDFPEPRLMKLAFNCDLLYYEVDEKIFNFESGKQKMIRTYTVANHCSSSPNDSIVSIPRRDGKHFSVTSQEYVLGTLEYTQVLIKNPDCETDETDTLQMRVTQLTESCDSMVVFSASVDVEHDTCLQNSEWTGAVYFYPTDTTQSPIIYNVANVHQEDKSATFEVELGSMDGEYMVRFTYADECGNTAEQMFDLDCKNYSTISGSVVTWIDASPIGKVTISNDNNVIETTDDGIYSFDSLVTGMYPLTLTKDIYPANGVSTHDLVLISKHILGLETFSSPYQYIAADVNNSRSITAFDMVQMRQLILNLTDTFPSTTSWKFIDAHYEFTTSTPQNEDYPTSIQVEISGEDVNNLNFVGVKIGDVSGNAKANRFHQPAQSRSQIDFVVQVEDAVVKAGEVVTVDFSVEKMEKLAAMQGTLVWSGLEFIAFNEAITNDSQFFNLQFLDRNLLPFSWYDLVHEYNEDDTFMSFDFLVDENADGEYLSDLIEITSDVVPIESVSKEYRLGGVELEFSDPITSIDEELETNFKLYQNTPNPFNGETVIGFTLPQTGSVAFRILDMSGRIEKTIHRTFQKGYHEISVTADELIPGMYMYQLESAGRIATRKMFVIK